MDAIETLRQNVHNGRISSDRLVDLIASLQQQFQTAQQQLQTAQQQLQTAQQQLQAARERLQKLEKNLGMPATTKLEEPFSLRAEEKRQQARGKKRQTRRQGRRGRLRTADKIAQAQRTEQVFPEGVARQDCRLSHVRPVWRLEKGQAVLIAYEIYRGPNSCYGQIPGALGRSEFGLEIVTEIAHLVYSVGVSFDKACMLLQFFQNLKVTKSQANALLYQLARHWERQFEVLCTLLANSLVVHTDETSWSIKSVWAFLSEKARLLLFGVPKDAETLKKILDPLTFAGIVSSDDAAVYENFSAAQKCWAHLLRKAIKLTLQDPDNLDYRDFTDRLLEIYRAACRLQCDRRFSAAGRAAQVVALDEELFQLCLPIYLAAAPPRQGLAKDYFLLVQEVLRLTVKEELLTFVTAEPVRQPNGTIQPVSGTNNEAERTLREPATARKTGRTNKTSTGARRQTVVTSVLESLRLYLPTFTLQSVLEELRRWWASGQSCFEKLQKKLKLKTGSSDKPIIEQLFPSPIPIPSG
jgi:transposase